MNFNTPTKIKIIRLFFFLTPFLLASPCIVFASDSNLTKTGDYLQILLPATALTTSYFFESSENKNLSYVDFAESFSFGLASVHIIKVAVEKQRPDGSNDHSFPSGHTYAAVSGATFIHSYFGYKYAIPAYALAAVVGYSRINAKAHFVDDVLAGASIAFLNNYFFNDSTTSLSVQSLNDTPVLTLKTDLDTGDNSSKVRNQRFALFMGPTFFGDSSFISEDTTFFKINSFTGNESSNFSSTLFYDLNLKKYGSFQLTFHPFEILSEVTVENPFSINETNFSSGEKVQIDWIQYDLVSEYFYPIVKREKLSASLGVGAYLNFSELEVTPIAGGTKKEISQFGAIGFAALKLSYYFSDKFSINFNQSFYEDAFVEFIRSRLSLEYAYNQELTFAIAAQYLDRNIELNESEDFNNNSTIKNESAYSSINLGLALCF